MTASLGVARGESEVRNSASYWAMAAVESAGRLSPGSDASHLASAFWNGVAFVTGLGSSATGLRSWHCAQRKWSVLLDTAAQWRGLTAALLCPFCPGGLQLVPTGRTAALSGHLCLRCGSAVTTPLVGSSPRGALAPADGISGDPATRLIRVAFAARARAERANVLNQQAGRLLNESERLIAEAQQMLRNAERDQ